MKLFRLPKFLWDDKREFVECQDCACLISRHLASRVTVIYQGGIAKTHNWWFCKRCRADHLYDWVVIGHPTKYFIGSVELPNSAALNQRQEERDKVTRLSIAIEYKVMGPEEWKALGTLEKEKEKRKR